MVAGVVGVVGVVVVLVFVCVVLVVVGVLVVEVEVVVGLGVGPVAPVDVLAGVEVGWHCETERVLTWLASLVRAPRRFAFTVSGRFATSLARLRVAVWTLAQ